MQNTTRNKYNKFFPSLVVLALSATAALGAPAQDAPTNTLPARVRFDTCKKPEYPPASIKENETGDVVLEFTISSEGNVTDVAVLKSSGFRLLDRTALEALGKCKFTPVMKDGTPIEGKAKVLYSWKIDPPVSLKESQPNQYLRQDAATGSNIRRSAVTSKLPMNKTWQQMTDEQKAYVKSFYEPMADQDEPPYPVNGLGPLYQALVRVQEALQVEGRLSLEVRVDSEGKPTSVDILAAPSQKMGELAGQIAMLTKYKPAICGGQSCTMSFPLQVQMTLRK